VTLSLALVNLNVECTFCAYRSFRISSFGMFFRHGGYIVPEGYSIFVRKCVPRKRKLFQPYKEYNIYLRYEDRVGQRVHIHTHTYLAVNDI